MDGAPCPSLDPQDFLPSFYNVRPFIFVKMRLDSFDEPCSRTSPRPLRGTVGNLLEYSSCVESSCLIGQLYALLKHTSYFSATFRVGDHNQHGGK